MKMLFIFIVCLSLFSCEDPCEGLECLSEDHFSFTIKATDTGEDLLFSESPKLAEEDVEIYYVVNGKKEPAHAIHHTSNVSVPLIDGVEMYYVSALNKTDTLSIKFMTKPAAGCCPTTIEIEQKSLNGDFLSEDDWLINLYR